VPLVIYGEGGQLHGNTDQIHTAVDQTRLEL